MLTRSDDFRMRWAAHDALTLHASWSADDSSTQRHVSAADRSWTGRPLS